MLIYNILGQDETALLKMVLGKSKLQVYSSFPSLKTKTDHIRFLLVYIVMYLRAWGMQWGS